MTAALLVVGYGAHALIERNLARTRLPADTLVVVVDNYTDADEREAMRTLAEREGWLLIAPDRNLGFGAGMNAAADAAIAVGADVLVLLNPDASIEGDGFEQLASAVAADADVQLSPRVIRPGGAHFASLMAVDLDRGRVRRSRSVPGERLWVSGACFAISTALWQRVGGFDDDFFLYWEDVDLSLRVTAAGGSVRVATDVTVVHDAGGTQHTGESKSPTYLYYNARNRLVFGAKHTPDHGAAWVRSSPAAIWNLLQRSPRRMLLRPTRSWVPALRGTVAGIRFVAQTRRAS